MLTAGHPGRVLALAIVLALSAAACGGDASSVSPVAPTSVTTVTTAASPPGAATQAAVPDLVSMLAATLQDEYHAQMVYQGVLNDFGQVWPFVNIITAEARHAQAIGQLFAVRGLAAPASLWSTGNVPHFASVRDACGVAAVAEVDNIALYDQYLALELPADVRTVFANNRAASLNGHLPAFNNCK